MALRDKFEKIISYFDTEDVNEFEQEQGQDQLRQRPEVSPSGTSYERVQANRPQAPVAPPQGERVSRPAAPSHRPAPPQAYPRAEQSSPAAPRSQQVTPSRPSAPLEKPQHQSLIQSAPNPSGLGQSQSQTQTKIALRYPIQYEDVPAIVDLLINNECVLIDFEQMQEDQARRCLDFIDGASKVLSGSLRRVGATIYLLAPAHVQVDVSDLLPAHRTNQATDFDYDMKRR